MKNIRVLLPIALVALMAFSCYSLVSQSITQNNEYKSYCAAAEKAEKDKITVDVEENYSKALEMKNTLNLYLKWGQYYVENELFESAVDLGKLMVDEYPNEEKAHEFLLENYLKVNDYENFFEEYKSTTSRGVKSKEINELYNRSKYLYSIDYNSYVDATGFSSKYARVLVDNFDSDVVNTYGFAKESGDLAIKDDYISCGYFNNDDISVAPVVDLKNEAYYIDNNGNRKYVISPEKISVVSLGMYSSGVLSVYDGKNYFLCDINSNIIGGPYLYLSTINSNVGVIEDNDGWKIINQKGEIISKSTFDGFVLDEKEIAFRQGCLIAKTGSSYVLVDEKGEQIGNSKFEDAKMFIDSYAAVKTNGKWGYIDNKGQFIIESQYVDAKSFSNGLAAVYDGYLWGYIFYDEESKKENIAITYSFKDVQNFSQTSNCAFVKIDDTWRLIKLYSND